MTHRTDLVGDRVRMVNRLRDVLSGYFPALERSFDYAQSRGALTLLTGYQTPDAIRRIGQSRLRNWGLLPNAFPKEFREDVIRVYRDSDASVAQVAKDFGISPSGLKRWLTIDDRNSAAPSPAGRAANESDALREANKRIKLLEQETEVPRRAAAYLSQAHLPGK